MARSLLAVAADAHCTLHSGIYYIISCIYLNKVNYVQREEGLPSPPKTTAKFNSLYTVRLIELSTSWAE